MVPAGTAIFGLVPRLAAAVIDLVAAEIDGSSESLYKLDPVRIVDEPRE